MRRLEWKLELIEKVESRAFEEAQTLPLGPVDASTHAYMRVYATGEFRHDLTQEVKAVTELGGGHWKMAPLVMEHGAVWINRGFIPLGRDAIVVEEPKGQLRVEGLLRISEPDGTLLEKNDPASERWVSRDVPVMSQHVGLANAKPYFIDADHATGPTSWPRGGLTKVDFRNSHLSYALTWYAMALLFFGAMAYVIYDRLKGSKATD